MDADQVFALSRKQLTLDDVLLHGTTNMDVIAVLKSGESHARKVLLAIGSRGSLFGIDPHNLDHRGEPFYWREIREIIFPLPPQGFTYVDNPERHEPLEANVYQEDAPRLKAEEPKSLRFPERRLPNPQNSVIICDDVIEGVKHTFDRVRIFMERHLGYNLQSDNPLHFGAVECVMDLDTVGYAGHGDINKIGLLKYAY